MQCSSVQGLCVLLMRWFHLRALSLYKYMQCSAVCKASVLD